MSYRDLKRLEAQKARPKVSVSSLRQTVGVHIKNPGIEITFEFNLIIQPAPDEILRRMLWEIQQELSRRGTKAG